MRERRGYYCRKDDGRYWKNKAENEMLKEIIGVDDRRRKLCEHRMFIGDVADMRRFILLLFVIVLDFNAVALGDGGL
jgi:hypothetical protein